MGMFYVRDDCCILSCSSVCGIHMNRLDCTPYGGQGFSGARSKLSCFTES